jgi:hypothetical protein
MNKETFIRAIRERRKVRLTFVSRDKGNLVRLCAPLDYGPSKRAKDDSDRFKVWNYDGPSGPHVMHLNPDQVLKIELLGECFDPAEFVTWDTTASPWFVSRDWGDHS